MVMSEFLVSPLGFRGFGRFPVDFLFEAKIASTSFFLFLVHTRISERRILGVIVN